MFSTILPVWAAAALLVLGCWGFGTLVVSSKKALVGLLAGWCAFLTLCAIAWVAGFSAHAMRPLVWIFLGTGLVAVIRGRRWSDVALAAFCTGVMTFFLCAPCLLWPGTLAYGAHGTDMWGYVCTAEWLYGHSIRDLPDVGHVALRFNWVWQVLSTRDRPLIYETLACLGAGTGLSPLQAYYMYPVALLSTIAIGISREPGVFGLKRWYFAVIPAILMAYHPLPVLHWIAGFFAGTVVGLLVSLAFSAIIVAEEGRPRTEALALGALMMVCCASYTVKFILVGAAVAGIPAVWSGFLVLRREGWRRLVSRRPGGLTMVALGIAVALALATFALAADDYVGTSRGAEISTMALGEFLGIFGGSSPYSWMDYEPLYWSDVDPLHNPAGLVALAVMACLFGLIARRRWRTLRDIRVPLLIGISLVALWSVSRDWHILAKATPVFGFALVIMLAAASAELRHWSLGLLAAIVCCTPFFRSAPKFWDMEHSPYITCTVDNLTDLSDANYWRMMAYLYFREDQDKNPLLWANPRRRDTYFALTVFLPEPVRQQLATKYHVPEDWSER